MFAITQRKDTRLSKFNVDALDRRETQADLLFDRVDGSSHRGGSGVMRELQINGQQQLVAPASGAPMTIEAAPPH